MASDPADSCIHTDFSRNVALLHLVQAKSISKVGFSQVLDSNANCMVPLQVPIGKVITVLTST